MQWILRAFLWYFVFVTAKLVVTAFVRYFEVDSTLIHHLLYALFTGYVWSGLVYLLYFILFMAGRFIFKAAGILTSAALTLLAVFLTVSIGYVWGLADFEILLDVFRNGTSVLDKRPSVVGLQFTTGLVFGIAYALFYYYRIEPERQG